MAGACHVARAYFNSRPSARGDLKALNVPDEAIISIHAPPRGATAENGAKYVKMGFQFTPLREGRLPPALARATRSYFNSRPSARGDPVRADAAINGVLFQFTPLREGRHRRRSRDGSPVLFQFTPLREGRPFPSTRTASRRISIHAPPRGATRPCLRRYPA